jgi:hypothetical protein
LIQQIFTNFVVSRFQLHLNASIIETVYFTRSLTNSGIGDGCTHHASFHNMENQSDDAIVKRWQAVEREQQDKNGQSGARKRPRKAIEGASTGQSHENAVRFGSVPTDAEAQAGSSRPGPNVRTRNRRGNNEENIGNSGPSRIIELSDDVEPEAEINAGNGGWNSIWK